MTISTGLFFDRAVTQLTGSKSDLSKVQEKVASGKELNRASDSVDTAVNVSRLKSAIKNLEGFENSLNSVNDRLRVEESYVQGVSDVLTKIKTLTIQGANASYNASDRKVIALEIRELTDEIKNLANGIDSSGNYIFSGTRVETQPYQEDANGIIRYQGDQVETELNFTATRKSIVGRSGPDVFQSVFSGRQLNVVPAEYEVQFSGTLEAGDTYQLSINGERFSHQVKSGQTLANVVAGLRDQVNEATTKGALTNVSASVDGNQLNVSVTDGTTRALTVSTANATGGQADESMQFQLANTPNTGRPEKVEFFESLQQVAELMETGTQDEIQGKLDHLDQMLDISTEALADLGVEMSTIETELALNADLKNSLQATLSSEEDIDYTKTITELQGRLLSLEAAQSSFAQISRLSIFDYLR
jgi:flagellar hook-associated protein 3 FlgL